VRVRAANISHISHVESGVVDKRASERLVVFQAAAPEQRFLPASSKPGFDVS
jgi:hypothetical protein